LAGFDRFGGNEPFKNSRFVLVVDLFIRVLGRAWFFPPFGFFNAPSRAGKSNETLFVFVFFGFLLDGIHFQRRRRVDVYPFYLPFLQGRKDKPRAVSRWGVRCGEYLEYDARDWKSYEYLPFRRLRYRFCGIPVRDVATDAFIGLDGARRALFALQKATLNALVSA
jgi:hypothetical protein